MGVRPYCNDRRSLPEILASGKKRLLARSWARFWLFQTAVMNIQHQDQPARVLAERITAATADIRNALVPLRTIAELLHHPDDPQSRDWCARMLEREVKRI